MLPATVPCYSAAWVSPKTLELSAAITDMDWI